MAITVVCATQYYKGLEIMPAIYETAYPRFKTNMLLVELQMWYTPTSDEIEFASNRTNQSSSRLAFLVMLKSFQRLGRFMQVKKVPQSIIEHIAKSININRIPKSLKHYDSSGIKRVHLKILRDYLGIKPFSQDVRKTAKTIGLETAKSKNDLSDIINVILEELIRLRIELPAFNTLVRIARMARNEANNLIFDEYLLLVDDNKLLQKRLNQLFLKSKVNQYTLWNKVKIEPKKPTVRKIRKHIEHLKWLESLNTNLPGIDGIKPARRKALYDEAMSLDARNMLNLKYKKRITLAIVLVQTITSKARDDIAEMFVKLVRNMHNNARNDLKKFRDQQSDNADNLIALLHNIVSCYHAGEDEEKRLRAISKSLEYNDPEKILENCNKHMAYSKDNYYPFLPAKFRPKRAVLFECIEALKLFTSSSDNFLISAIEFLKYHKNSKKDWLSTQLMDNNEHNEIRHLNLNWIPEKWIRLVTGKSNISSDVCAINRRYFEICVFSRLKQELSSGDVYVLGSLEYDDYRKELISDEEFYRLIDEYAKQAGIKINKNEFINELKGELDSTAINVDKHFLKNKYVRIENNELILKKISKDDPPKELGTINALFDKYMPKANILDIITDTEKWLNLSSKFKPLSGNEPKMDDHRLRFIITLFCYGFNLGPTQTARSIKGISRKQVAWLNLKHITEEKLDRAIAEVVNTYNKFELPKYWGTGKSASVDATKWDLYEENLLSEYHIRYGGYGGLGYYLLSDKYIALFSHFIPCGVYEAVYLLDALIKNKSDIQPDTIHGDTQSQSESVFGLSYLLGINLMPRMRRIKTLKLYRSDKNMKFKNINTLFSETIKWDLIETHFKDMLKIALSIKEGRISPSTLLRRLGTYSRKNKLYLAFRELGRVMRTIFILKYISDPGTRKMINAATCKSEEFNNFLQWAMFGGGGIIASNLRHEQRKIIKYNHLVANMIILYNVATMTQVINRIMEEGHFITSEILEKMAPFRTEHINRFGTYFLDLEREKMEPTYNIPFLIGLQSAAN
jgi:TnpA family transposase